MPRGAALFGKLANKNGVKYSHVWHPSAGCQISFIGYAPKLCAYVKYGIHAESTVLKWVKQYNSHEELTDSRKVRDYFMAKDIKSRKTTLEERIRIVEHCVSHSNDYSATAKEFNCSYGQVYSWVNKYSKKGVDGLKDGRGRNKSADELSELEKLRAENRLLKAEKKRQQIEIDLLKKLEEIERR